MSKKYFKVGFQQQVFLGKKEKTKCTLFFVEITVFNPQNFIINKFCGLKKDISNFFPKDVQNNPTFFLFAYKIQFFFLKILRISKTYF